MGSGDGRLNLSPIWGSGGFAPGKFSNYDFQICRLWCIVTATKLNSIADDWIYSGVPKISRLFCANPCTDGHGDKWGGGSNFPVAMASPATSQRLVCIVAQSVVPNGAFLSRIAEPLFYIITSWCDVRKTAQKVSHNASLIQVALLWLRDRATRLSVEILQLQNIPIVWHYLRDPTFSCFYTIPECDTHTQKRTDRYTTTACTALA